MSFKDSGEVAIQIKDQPITLAYLDLDNKTVIPFGYTAGGLPTAIVDDSNFQKLTEIQLSFSIYTGIDIRDKRDCHGTLCFVTFHFRHVVWRL